MNEQKNSIQAMLLTFPLNYKEFQRKNILRPEFYFTGELMMDKLSL